jgi:hypothetical protein
MGRETIKEDKEEDNDVFVSPPGRHMKGKGGESNSTRLHPTHKLIRTPKSPRLDVANNKELRELKSYYQALKNESLVISYGDTSYDGEEGDNHEVDWPGKQLSNILDREHINMFLKNEMTRYILNLIFYVLFFCNSSELGYMILLYNYRTDYVWKSTLASVCRLDVHDLIMGKEISINVSNIFQFLYLTVTNYIVHHLNISMYLSGYRLSHMQVL